MGVRAALAFLLLFVATVEAAEGGVTFWRTEFTMRCPQNGTWLKNLKGNYNLSDSLTLTYNSETKGFYQCKYQALDSTATTEITYYFYVHGKVCKDCFELDAAVFGWVIVVDVLATACVMAIVYRCTKKKHSAGFTQTSRAPALPGGRPPPVRSSDYEQLNPHTLSQDPYSAVNRMG